MAAWHRDSSTNTLECRVPFGIVVGHTVTREQSRPIDATGVRVVYIRNGQTTADPEILTSFPDHEVREMICKERP